MRVAHLTIEPPYAPGGTGGATRQYRLLSRLVELGHDVATVVPVTAEHEAETGAREKLLAAGIDYRPVRRPSRRPVELAEAVVRRPDALARVVTDPWFAWQFGVIWARARRAALREVVAYAPDVVTVEHDHLAGWVTALDAVRPIVLATQNATWRVYERRGLWLEAKRYRRYARRFVPRFDAVIAVSDIDAAEFTELGARRVYVVPNGARFDAPLPVLDDSGPPTVLFTGSMDHPPNRDAAQWLGREIWPLVRREVPAAQLVIAGRGPQQALRELASDPTIELAGEVPDMEPYFRRATLTVAPLRSGGGTRLKILEALAAGRAVVATPIGAEGLDLQPDRDLLVRDGKEDFAGGVVELLRSPERRETLAITGRTTAAGRYDWRSLGDELAGTLEQVTERTQRGRTRA